MDVVPATRASTFTTKRIKKRRESVQEYSAEIPSMEATGYGGSCEALESRGGSRKEETIKGRLTDRKRRSSKSGKVNLVNTERSDIESGKGIGI